MARKKTPKIRVNVKAALSRRLKEIRQELFGEHGGPELARRLSLPARTWYNYETGVTVPAEVLLAFIDQTGASPVWLLDGTGPKFRRGSDDLTLSELSPIELIRRGLEKLEQEPSQVVLAAPDNLPDGAMSDFVAVGLYPLHELSRGPLDESLAAGYVLAFRQWLPHPSETVAVRLEDDSMSPILPSGSVVAVDRTVSDPRLLHGRLVAAAPEGEPMIRWLELSGRHMILRPNVTSPEYPLLPVELDDQSTTAMIGQVVWSWSRFYAP